MPGDYLQVQLGHKILLYIFSFHALKYPNWRTNFKHNLDKNKRWLQSQFSCNHSKKKIAVHITQDGKFPTGNLWGAMYNRGSPVLEVIMVLQPLAAESKTQTRNV